MAKIKPQLPDQEDLLLDYAERLRKHCARRRAIHVRLSSLRPHNRRDHHMRIVRESFRLLIDKYEGQFFQLANDDIVFIGRRVRPGELDDAILKLRYMFRDDPFVENLEASGNPEAFSTSFDLQSDYAAFLDLARQLHSIRQTALAAVPADSARNDAAPRRAAGRPIGAGELARVETALETVDLENFLRRQYIYALAPGSAPQAVFCERYISIPALEESVLPGFDVSANRWLFQHLTECLDRRMLALLPDMDLDCALPTSLNINVRSVLSEEFLDFHNRFRLRHRKKLLIEIQAIDALSDMNAYLLAHQFLRDNDLRVCLDGMNAISFAALDRSLIPADFEKVIWSEQCKDRLMGSARDAFARAFAQTGPSRVVLCHCDVPEAIAFGQALGICLFQGRYVDHLAEPALKAVSF